jgi:hypothetical protein
MNRTATLLFVAALALAPLTADAREEVRGSQASERQLDFATKLGQDTETLLGAIRRVEITSYPGGRITTARGAEVNLVDREGNPAATVQRLEFRTPEDAARFFDGVVKEGNSDGRWGVDLAGKWVVRVQGPAASNPPLLESILTSAWKRGPKAGPREARVLSVLDGKGYVFEDNGTNPTISSLFENNMEDARSRSEQGQLVQGETLTDDTYSYTGDDHLSLTSKDGIRKGWLSTPDLAVMMPSYGSKFLTMKPKGGMLSALGNLLGGGN